MCPPIVTLHCLLWVCLGCHKVTDKHWYSPQLWDRHFTVSKLADVHIDICSVALLITHHVSSQIPCSYVHPSASSLHPSVGGKSRKILPCVPARTSMPLIKRSTSMSGLLCPRQDAHSRPQTTLSTVLIKHEPYMCMSGRPIESQACQALAHQEELVACLALAEPAQHAQGPRPCLTFRATREESTCMDMTWRSPPKERACIRLRGRPCAKPALHGQKGKED